MGKPASKQRGRKTKGRKNAAQKPEKGHRAAFNQLLDDAIFGVSKDLRNKKAA